MPAANAEQSIFLAALELKTAAERAAYLKSACGDDAALLANVQELLAAHEQGDSFLDHPPAAGPATTDEPVLAERPGTVIGPYKLMEQIGEGGMGLVFVAEQQQPVRRKVALKVIKPGMDTREVIARFEVERQALALMDHPNIARVLDAGATDSGRPYFVMELVKGVPITDYCDRNELTPGERLELFVSVCQAVQHAHTKGIIHRDLKPSNILIAPHDGKPVVKVIDFGVAKAVGQPLTDKTIYTRLTQMIGTPVYMSPEQAEINALDVDTRSDVYALAVLLYELLTGTTPFDRQRFGVAAFDEIRRIIREEEPPRPSMRLTTLGDAMAVGSAKRKTELGRLSALVKGDLDWIVMKGLDKDRTRRYETASALAADVRRYLSEEPVEARPPSAAYRLRKFVKRNRGPALAASLVLLAVLAGIAVASWGWIEALTQRDHAVQARQDEAAQRELALAKAAEAETNERKAEQNAQLARDNETKAEWRLYASHIASAQREWEAGDPALFYHYLEQCRPDFRGWEHDFLYTLANQNQQTLRGHKDGIYGVAFSPDGKLLASAGRGRFDQKNVYSPGEVKIWDAAGGQVLRTLTGHTSNVMSVAFSPDSKTLASTSFGSTEGPGEIKIWDVASGQLIRTLKGLAAAGNTGVEWFNNVAFSPDGKRVASASRQHLVKIWDTATGQEVLACKRLKWGGWDSVAFSPDGKRLASASWGEPIKVLDAATGQVLLTVQGSIGTVRNIAFSPDGKRLAGASADKMVQVWDAATGQEVLACKGHMSGVCGVAFSSDSRRLASAGADSTVRVWDAAGGQELLTLRGHTGAVSSVAFSPDGNRLVSAGGDGTVKIWDLARAQGGLGIQARQVAFAPNGKLAMIADRTSTLHVWDAATGQEVRTLLKDVHGGIDKMILSPDGKRIAGVLGGTGLNSGQLIKVWDAASGQELLTLKGHANGVTGLAFSPDGGRLASAEGEGTVKVWDAATGAEILTFKGHANSVTRVAFSPDGKRLASASWDGTVKVWDAATGAEYLTFKGHTVVVDCVVFSPDGKRLASSGGSAAERPPSNQLPRELKVWDAATGQEFLTLKGHSGAIMSVAFSPDGKRLATASYLDPTVKVWDAATGQELLTLKGHPQPDLNVGLSVVFSPDGKRLAGASMDGTVKVWDAAGGQEVLTLKGTEVVFTPDGQLATLVDRTGTLHVWDAATGREVPTPLKDVGGIDTMTFSPDGKRLAGTSTGFGTPFTVGVWDTAGGEKLLTLTGDVVIFQCMAFSPDGKLLATTGYPDGGGFDVPKEPVKERTVQVWDTASGQVVRTLRGHTEFVHLAFSPDGKRLAGASAGLLNVPGFGPPGEVRVWDTATGRDVLTFKGKTHYCVAFSPDGKLLASGTDDNTVQVWDAASGQEVQTLRGHTGSVSSVAFSPDGKRLASASNDGTVKLWDAASGQEVLTLRNAGGPLAFSPDGKRLAASSMTWDASKSMKEAGLK